MGKCFVIQPFDEDNNKRYYETIAPAIKDAGPEPYRVDQDPSSEIIIHDIEEGIINSDICLAEITEDNPNVWYELGYSIAKGKKVVLICSNKNRRSNLPFDIQHRKVIYYQTGSLGGFHKLRNDITENIKALLSDHNETAASKMAENADSKSSSQQNMPIVLTNLIDWWFNNKNFTEEKKQNLSLEEKINYLCLKATEEDIDYLKMLKSSFEQMGDSINSLKLDEIIAILCKKRLKNFY